MGDRGVEGFVALVGFDEFFFEAGFEFGDFLDYFGIPLLLPLMLNPLILGNTPGLPRILHLIIILTINHIRPVIPRPIPHHKHL